MFLFAAADTLQGAAGTASAITVSVWGVNVTVATGAETFGLLFQGQLPTSTGVLFTVPAGQAYIVKSINISNATASAVAGVQLFQHGAAAANSLIGPLTMAGHYTLTGSENGWAMTDAAGSLQTSGGGGGGGTVSSVGLSMPAEFTVSGSPVTGSGTLTAAKANQAINIVYAGPNSGSPGAPSFRALVPADLPVGSNTQLGALQVDGTTITAAAGVISAAGGGGNYVLVSTSTPSGVSSVTLSSLGSYSDLIVVVRGASTTTTATQAGVSLQFNSDTGGNYDTQTMGANASSQTNTPTANATSIQIGWIGGAGSGGVANQGGAAEGTVYSYGSSSFHKQVLGTSLIKLSSATSGFFTAQFAGWWRNTAAITSVTVFISTGNFASGSTVSLYGRS